MSPLLALLQELGVHIEEGSEALASGRAWVVGAGAVSLFLGARMTMGRGGGVRSRVLLVSSLVRGEGGRGRAGDIPRQNLKSGNIIRKFIYNNNVYVSIKITSFFVNKKYYFKLNVTLKSALINISAVSKRAEQMINIYIIIKKC